MPQACSSARRLLLFGVYEYAIYGFFKPGPGSHRGGVCFAKLQIFPPTIFQPQLAARNQQTYHNY